MRIALVPMQVDPVNMDANMEAVEQWVDDLYEAVQLILFPRLIFPSLPEQNSAMGLSFLSHQYADLLCSFAQRRKVFIAAEFLGNGSDEGLRMLVLSDRMGQMDAQSRLTGSDAISPSSSLFITARIAGERIGVASADDLERQRLPIEATLWKIKALVVPLHFAGSQPEIRRVTIHNPPAALEDLKKRLSHVARMARVHVLAVNALGEDSDTACGPCGGSFVFDPSGDEIQSREILDREHFEFELPSN